jgi:hypothetical protein
LNINSKEIERANIINTKYFFSENVFDGIVSFITKKGKIAVEYYTSDESYEYFINVEGICTDGKTGVSSMPLIIKSR